MDSLARVSVLSRVDSVVLIVVSVAVAIAASLSTVSTIISNGDGEVVLRLPLDPSTRESEALDLGAVARVSEVQATVPVLPVYEASLLGWSAAMNLVAVLCVVSLLVLLAYRLTSRVLFGPRTAVIVGSVGMLLAISGSAAQILDSTAKSRLAEQLGAMPARVGETLVYISGFDPAPLVAGGVLVLLGGVFQFGRRLQGDTEGLV
ncbi:hypothetical protein StoSoilA2_03630 [Arthrobacter sp. StoSoilA2]|uniref:hypothetical protein n=1 Tax=Arthrobacter sp. StoSoilA2 TaxID=2830990 RepID=UPI001CC5A965|nr:hypothetical protein [Arthrobacter sp. StoSoilA2]BCW34307.1 hypothetical protein StoSoilA2_03630 [Arthrobacter sp. StoSoilA2]